MGRKSGLNNRAKDSRGKMSIPIIGNSPANLRAGGDFIEIPIASLRLDTITSFDIYTRPTEDGDFVLYAERNIPFTEASRRRLRTSKVESLYVKTTQREQYRRYLETNLPSMLKDPTIDSEAKAEVLHSCAQGLMREIFENPYLDGGIRRCRDVVRNSIDFIFSERSSLRHLIESASRDYNNYTHSVNGCILGIALAMRMGFKGTRHLNEFGRGALLRDVGMSQVDQAILDSPGKLTDEQRKVIQAHPRAGEQFLVEHGEASPIVMELIRHHHERMNGSGYPDGIYGDDLSPMVRILSIVDVFDALTTDRPHRDALTSFDALQLMSREMVQELDQDILREFIALMGDPQL